MPASGVVRSQPLDIRITQVSGGYTINKFGGNEYHPLEVCVSLSEVQEIINVYFTDAQINQAGVESADDLKINIGDLPA